MLCWQTWIIEEQRQSMLIKWAPGLNVLIHLPLVPHICVSELGHIGSDNSTPSHYLNQCWLVVNWTPVNKFRWKSNRSYISFLKKCIWNCRLLKWLPFCPRKVELIFPTAMCPNLTQLLWCLVSPRETIVLEIEEITRSHTLASHSTVCKLADTVKVVTGTFSKSSWPTLRLYKPGPGRRATVIHVHQNDLNRQLISRDKRWSDENRL